MVLFGKTHQDFLKDYLSLPNGIPSHDTFRRVFTILESDVLRTCLNDYGKDMVGLLSEKQICLDGKKLKGVSPTSRGNSGFSHGLRKTVFVSVKRKLKTRVMKLLPFLH